MFYLAIFGLEFFKKYCHIWNQHRQMCLFGKLQEKTRMPKFGTKNTWFGYFGTRIWKQYCHIWNQHLPICKRVNFCEISKMPKFRTKNYFLVFFWPRMCYLGIFGKKLFLKNYCHIRNQHPRICRIAKFCEKNKNAYIFDQKCFTCRFLG